MLPYTSFICSMSNPWFYSLWVCFRLFVVLVSATAQLRVGCHSGKFILVVYKMNDLNLSFVTRTPKSFQIHFTSNCLNCFTAKVVSVFVFLSAGDTCLYAPILATCQSPPVASPCNQTQSQKCRHSQNTKKRNTWVGLLFTMTSLLLDRVYLSQRNLSSTSRRLEGSTIRGVLKIFCRMYWRKPKTP